MVNESNSIDLAQVQQLAAEGHFRAIALWVNHSLMRQGIYAQIQAAKQPGCLRILLEFKRPPKKEAIIRLVCHRLWQLNSPVIEGAHIVARPIGQSRILWQRRAKILTPLQRQQKRQKQRKVSYKTSHQTSHQTSRSKAQPTAQPVATPSKRPARPSPWQVSQPLSTPTAKKPRSPIAKGPAIIQPNHQVIALATLETQSIEDASRRAQRRRRALRRSRQPTQRGFFLEQQFKLARAVVVTGSAAAAFILGCLTELVMSGNGPTLPSLGAPTSIEREWGTGPEVDATEVTFNNSIEASEARFIGNRIEAALEPVAVISHHQVSDPTDPTVTLLFGGEVSLGQLDQSSPAEADQLLSQVTAYQQADISMVNLGNSLATAGTSLQENYHHRTRPDAVAALKEGGVDIVGLTSDRTMDYGTQGLIETLETLDKEGIYRVGAGRDQREARRPEILEVKGQRIAYLGYTPASVRAADAEKAGTNAASEEMILADIEAIRPDVDWVVVNYRWLGDLAAEPEAQQVELSRMAVNAGADLVVGYHPTQLQGAEIYKGRPIVYALGDFIFEDAPLEDHDTAALKVSLNSEQMKVEFLPVAVRKAVPQAAMGEAGEVILQKIRQASKEFPAPMHFPVVLETQPHPSISPKVVPTLDANDLTVPINPWGEVEPAFETLDRNQSLEGIESPINPFAPNNGEGITDQGEGNGYNPRGTSDWGASDWGNDNRHYGENGYGQSGYSENGYGESGYDESLEENFDYWPDAPTEDIDRGNEAKEDETFSPSQNNPGVVNPSSQGGFEADIESGVEDGFIDDQTPTGTGDATLENWGPKSSPHPDFNPIPNDSMTLDETTGQPQNAFGAEPVRFEHPQDNPVVEEINQPVGTDESPLREAIQPYGEPLVGPLTQATPEVDRRTDELVMASVTVAGMTGTEGVTEQPTLHSTISSQPSPPSGEISELTTVKPLTAIKPAVEKQLVQSLEGAIPPVEPSTAE